MKKTISFAILHFSVAFTVAYLLTGELLTASLIALIEPAVNTVAFYFHDLGWHKLKPDHSLQAKTSSFALVHFSVAFAVVYLLSGELLTGGVMALIEPAINTVVFFFHERLWRARQQLALARFGDTVRWVDALPAQFDGVVVGNEVLDAMPVQLLARHGGQQGGVWHERGVVVAEDGSFAWADRPTALRPPIDIEGPQDYLTEIHAQGEGFIRMLADRLTRGAAFLLDYGFGEDEYYHPQRHMGTVMCHQGHLADGDPLVDVGRKDITAHVNFTAMALAAQEAGMQVLGYTTQAHFLINCGLLSKMELLAQAERATAAKLIMEHEMGELFKVLALGAGDAWEPVGFARGDRSHRL